MSNQLSDKVQRYLNAFNKEVEDGFKKDKEDVAEEGAEKLNASSPKRTGKYASGWGTTKRSTEITIHNKKRAGLTHLLEKGHAKRNGGRVKGITHIEPVEEYVIDELEKRLIKRITK